MERLKRKIMGACLAAAVLSASLGTMDGVRSAAAATPPAPINSMDDMYSLSYGDGSIQSDPLLYRLYVPANYDASQKYPLLVYLNGAGSDGTDNTAQLNNLAPLIDPLINNPDYPCLIAVPQLPTTDQWVNTGYTKGSYSTDSVAESNSMKLLLGMINDLQNTYSIDGDRLYLMGQSIGGYGTWDAILRHPGLFAAAIPMCGAGDPAKAPAIKNMPLLILHGDADPTVPVSGSRDMAAALQAAGSTSYTYLEYPGNDHYVQRRLFEQPELWMPWLFSQVKGQPPVTFDSSSYTMPSLYYDFDSADQLNDWTSPGSGVWSVSGEQLSITTAANSSSMAVVNNTGSLSDGELSAYITLPANYTGGGGLVLRVSGDRQNYIHFRFSGADTVQLIEFQNGAAVQTTTQTYHWVPGRIANIRAVLSGAHVTVYVDNSEVFDRDIVSAALKTSGGIGLRYYNGAMKVDDVTWYPAAAGALTLSGLSDRQVIQRDPAAKTGRVSVSSSYDGSRVASVKATIVGYDDQSNVVLAAADATLDTSASTYTYGATVPQGGWYCMVVNAYDSGGALVKQIKSGRWGVGINILCMGQSNMVGMGAAPYVAADDRVSNFMNETWSHLTDPYCAGDTSVSSNGTGCGGSMVPSLCNALVSRYGVPVGIIPAALGGTALLGDPKVWSIRNAGNPFDRSNLYGNSIYRARAAGGIEFIVMNQGEHDVSNSVSGDDYLAALQALIANYRSDLNGAGVASPKIPFIFCQLGPAKASTWGNDRDPYMTGIRSAQFRADDAADHIFLGATEFGLARNSDDLHYTTASQAVIGARIANTIEYSLGDSDYYMGPVIAGAQYAAADDTAVDISIRQNGGTDITPASGITGFEVLDGSGNVGITSAVRLGPTTIRLTLQKAPGAGATVRYLYGLLPDDSHLVKDNTPLELPLNATVSPLSIATYQDPAPTQYAISIGHLQNGSVAADKQTAAEYETVSLMVTPDAGYVLVPGSLKANGVAISGSSFSMPTQDVTVTATFAADKTALDKKNAQAESLLPSADKIGTGSGQYPQKQVDSLTAAIATAQKVLNDPAATPWQISDSIESLQCAIGALKPNAPQYAISIGHLQNGSVAADKQTAAENETVSLMVTPDAGYVLVPGSLKANGVAISGSSFSMPTQDVTVTATFAADKTALDKKNAQAESLLPPADKIGTGSGQYPQKQVDSLTAAIATAQKVLNDPAATPRQVSDSIASLQRAISALKPNAPQSCGGSPDTGDTLPEIPAALLLLSAVAAAVLLRRAGR